MSVRERTADGDRVSVRSVGLVPHPNRDTAAELARHASTRLAEHGIEVRCPTFDDATALDATGLDVVISLGGDGTMLRAVDLAYEAGVPVLGVTTDTRGGVAGGGT